VEKKRKGEAEEIVRQLLADGEALYTSRINVAELYVGAELSNDPAAEYQAIRGYLAWVGILELDDRASRAFGSLRADLQKRGRLSGDMDMLIAAMALANGETVVTRNAAHFRDMPGVKVVGYGS